MPNPYGFIARTIAPERAIVFVHRNDVAERIALKLAQFDFVKQHSGQKPILLFDDIFDKLDETRVSQIVDMVNHDDFGQLFISDTHPDRTEAIVSQTHQSYKMFRL